MEHVFSADNKSISSRMQDESDRHEQYDGAQWKSFSSIEVEYPEAC